MMGPSHALCGAAAWVAVTADYTLHVAGLSVPVGWGLMPVGDAGVVTGALLCAGAALLPDIDHPGGTVARSLPPFSGWLARGVSRIAGGHRRGTHSVLGVAVLGILAWLSQTVSIPVGDGLRWLAHSGDLLFLEQLADALPGQVWPLAALLSVLLMSFAVKVLAFIPDRVSRANWIAAGTLGVVVGLHPPEHPWWFVVAVVLGCVVHLLGDLITVRGIHLLWPLRLSLPLPDSVYRGQSFFRWPILGRAGSRRETLIMAPITAFTLTGLGCAVVALGGVSLG